MHAWMHTCTQPYIQYIIHTNTNANANAKTNTETNTVKGQSRGDSLLLSPYHWAKLFRGVVAIVAVPMRFAVICWIVLEAFVGQIHVFPLGSWMTIQVPGLSRISFWKPYREAVRLEKVQVSHHHNF